LVGLGPPKEGTGLVISKFVWPRTWQTKKKFDIPQRGEGKNVHVH
jgi:hypothetical protein